MSNQSKTKSTLTLKSFRGIDHRASHTDEQAASDIINFRIRSDGSLEKRPGFRLLTNLGADIRAFYHKITEGCEIGYALAGNTLFAVDLLTGTKETLGTVTTSTGNACIFFYQSLLYLLDGSEIYVLGNGSLTPVSGYIPLVGKDWPTDVVGEPYEPKNILTRRVRISYAVSADRPSIFMCTGEPVESVEAVWRNGVLLDPEAYYIDEGFGTVNVVGTEKGDRLEIYMTLKQGSDELRRLLLSASRSLFFGGAEDSRLFFWGASDPSLILCTAYVPKESQIASSRLGGNGNDLYFPQGYEFRLGDAAHRIQSCAPHYDRILIFTENDTWMASTDVSGLAKLSLTPINSEIGCAAFNGAVAAGNHPVSIGGSSLYQWNQESNFPDRCNAKRISEEIDDVLTRTMLKSSRLFYDPYHEELWFFHPTNGIVWIRILI